MLLKIEVLTIRFDFSIRFSISTLEIKLSKLSIRFESNYQDLIRFLKSTQLVYF